MRKVPVVLALVLFAAVVAGCSLKATEVPVGPVNLVKNGSFEDDMRHWSISFPEGNKSVAIVTDRAYAGEKSVLVKKWSHGSSIGVGQRVYVTPGQRYRATVWVQVENLSIDPASPADTNDARIRVQFFKGGEPGALVYSAQNEDTNGEWKQLVLDFTVPADANDYVNLELLLTRANGDAWFDDVVVVPLEDEEDQ